MVEALGADTLVHVAVGGRPVIARLPHGTPAVVGEPIALAAAHGRVYLFDAETGQRIAAS
jgi:multiple sugar transport system ATP-binding protein